MHDGGGSAEVSLLPAVVPELRRLFRRSKSGAMQNVDDPGIDDIV